MPFPIARANVEAAFIAACQAELDALKPGNVHVHADGHGMDIHHFQRAAAAAAPFVADPGAKAGSRILEAVRASFAVTGLNTNLGIVLLCVPLAVAAQMPAGPVTFRDRLKTVLDNLDVDDAAAAFEAIVIANPAGLGRSTDGDVRSVPAMSLRDAMAIAAGRDRIALAYVNYFDDILTLGLPKLHAARRSAESETLAVTALHMTYLAAFPDSHIVRKHGLASATTVQREAQALAAEWREVPNHEAWPGLLAFDRSLKERGLNPGTTADLVVATVFADKLIDLSATTRPV